MSIQVLEKVRQGLSIVDNNCDGSVEKDSVGFNKFDAPIAKKVLGMLEWNDKLKFVACKMFVYYNKQHGLDTTEAKLLMNDLKAKIELLEDNSKKILIINNVAVISFPYSSKLVTEVKNLGSMWNPENKTWKLILNDKNKYDSLTEFSTKNDFSIEGVYVNKQEQNKVLSSSIDGTIKTTITENYVSLETISYDGSLKIIGSDLIVTFQYNPNAVTDLKSIDTYKKWNGKDKNWLIKNIFDCETDIINEVIKFGNTYNLQIDPILLNLSKPKKQDKNEIDIISILKQKYPKAFPYQLEGVAFMLGKKKSYNGSTMGTGKSLMTLLTIDYADKLPALIICPNSLKYNWALEVEKFIGNRSCSIINSTDKILEKGKDIYIINYDIVVKKLEQLLEIPFKFLALDESHFIKESKTKRFKAIESLVKGLNLEYRVLLSGTCITNRPKELVPQLKILDVLGKIVNKDFDFFLKYCNAYRSDFGWDISGASNTQELYGKLKKHCYIRYEIQDVIKDLPDMQENTVYLEINNRKEYNSALTDLIAYLSNLRDEEVSIGAEHLVQIEVLKQLVAKGKIDSAKEWIQNVLDSDEKLVLFAHHKEIISELKKQFPNALLIDGSVSAEDRQKAVDSFQNNPSKNLIICSIKSASVGLTLTASSKVAFLELPWTPADLDQASARVYRIGQKNNVNVYYLLGKNTIEDLKIMPLIEKKRLVFNAVARGEQVKAKDLNISMLSELVGSLIKK